MRRNLAGPVALAVMALALGACGSNAATNHSHLWNVGYKEGEQIRQQAGLAPDPNNTALVAYCDQSQLGINTPTGVNLTQWGDGFQAGCDGS